MLSTIYDLYADSVRRYPKNRRFYYFLDGKYTTLSTVEFDDHVRRIAYALTQLRVKHGDKIALISYNRFEWAVIDYAIQMLGCVTVPIYTTLPSAQIDYIIKDSDSVLVIAENKEIASKVSHTKIITIDTVDGFMSYKELVRRGRAKQAVAAKPSPDDIATLIYTSGTTGEQKGVMLSHKNLVSNILSSRGAIPMTARDTLFSFLPISHSFQRIVDYMAFYQGATIGYPESIDKILDNIKQIRPTVMACVPRMLEKIYQKIEEERGKLSGIKAGIFNWAFKVGRESLNGNGSFSLSLKKSIANLLVFRKIRKKLGGRIRILTSGASGLSPDIALFLSSCNLTILEGYGLTEASPVVSCNTKDQLKLGTVGKAIEGVEVKLADDNELLVRGPNIMKGYYKKPAETAEVLKDGWLYTGDIAEIDQDGFIKIIDRKKDLFKTSGGKYIAPQQIENMLKSSKFIQDAIVIGNGRKYPAALVVPNVASITGDLHETIKGEIDRINESLSQPEKIKNFAIIKEGFSIKAGQLTPTLKVKRNVIEKAYKNIIDKLYEE